MKKRTKLIKKLDVTKLKDAREDNRFKVSIQRCVDAQVKPAPCSAERWDSLVVTPSADETVSGDQRPVTEERISSHTRDLTAECNKPPEATQLCRMQHYPYQAYFNKDREFNHNAPRDKREKLHAQANDEVKTATHNDTEYVDNMQEDHHIITSSSTHRLRLDKAEDRQFL